MVSKKQMIQIALVTLGSIHLFSCSPNTPAYPSINPAGGCPLGIGGMDPSCCDVNGAVISPPPSATCGVTIPGGPGMANTLGAGAAAAGSSTGENQAAAQLSSVKGGVGLASGEGAATAGAMPVTIGATGTSIPLQSSGLGVTSSGSASTPGSNGIGSSDVSGSVATAPAAVAAATPPDSNALASGNSAGSGVQYGAGGGLLPNGAHSTGFQFGNGFANGDGADGAHAAEIGFGAQRNPATMAGEDPSDYFTRIGLEDSLFKKVEKRYRSTSANWETASLAPQVQVRAKAPK